MRRIRKKKVNYPSLALKNEKRYGGTLYRSDVFWILDQFARYFVKSVIRGYTFNLFRMKFKAVYLYSDEIEKMERSKSFAGSSIMVGTYFTIISEGGFPGEWKTIFKPGEILSKYISEELDDPDLIYKLIS